MLENWNSSVVATMVNEISSFIKGWPYPRHLGLGEVGCPHIRGGLYEEFYCMHTLLNSTRFIAISHYLTVHTSVKQACQS